MSRRRNRKFKLSRSMRAGLKRAGTALLLLFVVIGILTTVRFIGGAIKKFANYSAQNTDEGLFIRDDESRDIPAKKVKNPPEIKEELLTPNEYSRSQLAINEVNAIVVHYTANPGSTAEENRNYFENLMYTHKTKASSHYIIGLEGEIIRCIPENEMSYASNNRNSDTISIECCHPLEDGEFAPATYVSLIELVSYLMGKYDLSISQVIRHYDVSGKNCPKYYVEHENAWNTFLTDVRAYINKYGE